MSSGNFFFQVPTSSFSAGGIVQNTFGFNMQVNITMVNTGTATATLKIWNDMGQEQVFTVNANNPLQVKNAIVYRFELSGDGATISGVFSWPAEYDPSSIAISAPINITGTVNTDIGQRSDTLQGTNPVVPPSPLPTDIGAADTYLKDTKIPLALNLDTYGNLGLGLPSNAIDPRQIRALISSDTPGRAWSLGSGDTPGKSWSLGTGDNPDVTVNQSKTTNIRPLASTDTPGRAWSLGSGDTPGRAWALGTGDNPILSHGPPETTANLGVGGSATPPAGQKWTIFAAYIYFTSDGTAPAQSAITIARGNNIVSTNFGYELIAYINSSTASSGEIFYGAGSTSAGSGLTFGHNVYALQWSERPIIYPGDYIYGVAANYSTSPSPILIVMYTTSNI